MSSTPSERNADIEILVAEDSATQAELLGYLLRRQNYTVTIASNGVNALAAARIRKPTLLISDIVMPEMDGYELCKAIKSDAMLKDVPVVLVTTLSDPQDVVRGLECGADNFIRKPYDERYLLSRIEHLLMTRELRRTQKMQFGVEIDLGGKRHFINAERQQILDLLISTYEQAIQINAQLKDKERELADSNQMLVGLYRIAEGLIQTITPQDVADTVVSRAAELPGVQACWMFLRDSDDAEFRLVAERNLPPKMAAVLNARDACRCLRQLVDGTLGTTVHMHDCERLQRVGGDAFALQHHASVPLWLGDRKLGVLNLAGPNTGLFDENALQVLHGIGHQVAVALERARLQHHLEQQVELRTAALTQALLDLNDRHNELQDFAFVASHDLQEPLRKIRTFSDRLLTQCADQLDATARDYLDRSMRAAERMQTLVLDVLAYSRIAVGDDRFRAVPLEPVLKDVIEDLDELIESSDGRVDVGALPTIEGDPTQLRQLFQNLIANSLRYRAPGRSPLVTISAALVPSDGTKHSWELRVDDNGIGFAPEYAERIFIPFQRLHGPSEYGGTGIGLAIVRRIVARHRGSVRAEGRPGQGATFMLTFPERRDPR